MMPYPKDTNPNPVLVVTPNGISRRAWLRDSGLLQMVDKGDKAAVFAWENVWATQAMEDSDA